jgi:hypothetical protein
MSVHGTFRECRDVRCVVASGVRADMTRTPILVAIDPNRTSAHIKHLGCAKPVLEAFFRRPVSEF